ncbi:MAG: hypothetical protein WBG85_14075 [Rhodanobacter sp.]|jgi:hypothetical protein
MIILSWNIQKINPDKASAFTSEIGRLINEIVGDQPFVLIVYENKTQPDEVVDAIGTGIHASSLTKHILSTGGTKQLNENILIVAGNGATVESVEQFTGWTVPFDQRNAQMLQIAAAAAHARHASLPSSSRPSTQLARDDRLAKEVRGNFRPSDDFRNPAAIVVAWGLHRVKMLALHAPGPSMGDDHDEPYAHTYAEAIFQKADGYDLVLGDFNLRTHEVSSPGFVEQSVLLGATTKGKEEGRHTYSRLDRVYARPGTRLTTALITDEHEKQLTDHHILAVRVETSGPALITDYFPYNPSARRRREIIAKNRRQAFEERRRGFKETPYQKSLKRRIEESAARRKAQREDFMQKFRHLPDNQDPDDSSMDFSPQ